MLSAACAIPIPDAAPRKYPYYPLAKSVALIKFPHTAVIIYDRRTPNPATEALNRLEKRSSSISLTCYTETNCSGTATGHSVGGFSSNQPCINAANCQCMVVTQLDNAHLAYWNGQACSGNKSILNGCFSNGNVQQPSPGTNSLGFHTGCTGS
ncbi:hypothetical protein CJF30_00000865 [Rutstroemia sp. NJR-2017a BBW]|nr:hypothetical protein CJF30_00000865 [Rutstroemia sp. NJR-2017a BBW]